MQKENNFSLVGEYNNWITFYLNYLNPYFSEENFSLFQKKWQSYWKLFQLWKEKKLDNEEIKLIIKELIETKKIFPSLIKKYEKKQTIDNCRVEKQLMELWNEELKKMLVTNRQKIQNYLLGQLRKKFANCSTRELIEIISIFLKEREK